MLSKSVSNMRPKMLMLTTILVWLCSSWATAVLQFVSGDAGEWVQAGKIAGIGESHLERVDVTIANPPRGGLRRGAMPDVTAVGSEYLLISACNYKTMASDLADLVRDEDGGGHGPYILEDVTLFDMFPGTRHVETVAWLRQRH